MFATRLKENEMTSLNNLKSHINKNSYLFIFSLNNEVKNYQLIRVFRSTSAIKEFFLNLNSYIRSCFSPRV